MQIYMPFSIKLRKFDTVSKFDLDARDKEKARVVAGNERKDRWLKEDNIRLFWQRRGRLFDLCR